MAIFYSLHCFAASPKTFESDGQPSNVSVILATITTTNIANRVMKSKCIACYMEHHFLSDINSTLHDAAAVRGRMLSVAKAITGIT